jgi:hypothetical protein
LPPFRLQQPSFLAAANLAARIKSKATPVRIWKSLFERTILVADEDAHPVEQSPFRKSPKPKLVREQPPVLLFIQSVSPTETPTDTIQYPLKP